MVSVVGLRLGLAVVKDGQCGCVVVAAEPNP